MSQRKIYFCSLAALLIKMSTAHGAEWFNAGPLYDDFSLTLAPGHRTEAAGPFFYSEKSDTQTLWGVPPLFWKLNDPAIELERFHLGYPIFTYNRYGSEYRWQLFQLLSFAGGRNQPDSDAKRFTIFPVYFNQRSTDTNQNYTAVFPFYGRVKNRLFADEIFAVMFPLYSQTRKGDVVTDKYLFPFFHVRHGESLHGWKAFPIAGHQHKDPTTRTDGFGDVTIRPGHDRGFILAPFYFYQTSGIGTTNVAEERALLPLYSYLRSPQRDSTTVIWPLITHVTDREKKYTEWQTPWPLVVFARGEGKQTSRVWPLFSHSQNANQESGFYLWPVYKYNRFHAPAVDRNRTRILFFLYSDIHVKNLETGKHQRRNDFWPLFTRTRDLNGNDRLQIFAPLEPILPFSESVEREYSPVWSVWRAEKNPSTGAKSQSFLWNLYRRQTTASSKKCSLLFGLFQYESSPEGKQLRLFYVPVRKSPRASADASEEPNQNDALKYEGTQAK